MRLIYFDESKPSIDNPTFFIGGLMLPEDQIIKVESSISQIAFNFFRTAILSKDTEIHGKSIFHGKDNFKKFKMDKRIGLFRDIASVIINFQIPIRMVKIDVKAHREKYSYPEPEYGLGLMLFLERCCDYLEKEKQLGIAFGDYEEDELTQSILDFSQYKFKGKTPMYYGRPLGLLIDTLYFTHSHHSRFLQVADVIVFLANRFNSPVTKSEKWHDQQGATIWDDIKKGTDFYLQTWP